MKRISIILVLTSILALSLSAVPSLTSFRPLEREYRAMGESGMSLKGSSKGFSVNPAALSTDKFSLILPSVSLGVGSFYDIMGLPFNEIMEGKLGAVSEILTKLTGFIPLLDAQLSSSLVLHGFGFSIDGDLAVYSLGEGLSTGLVPCLKTGTTFGYGHRFSLTPSLDLEAGIVAHNTSFFYSTPIDINLALDLVLQDMENLNFSFAKTSLFFDVGTTLRSSSGFSLALSANGIGGSFTSRDVVKDETVTLYPEFSLDAGVGWERVFWSWLGLKAALDIKDITGLFSDLSFSELLYHMNMGMKLNLTKGLGLMCGLKGGYPSFGLDLKLFFFDLSLLYTTDEYSEKMGYNPRDTLSVLVGLEF